MKRDEQFYGLTISHHINAILSAFARKDLENIKAQLRSLSEIIEDKEDAVMVGGIVCNLLQQIGTPDAMEVYACVRHTFRSGDASQFHHVLCVRLMQKALDSIPNTI